MTNVRPWLAERLAAADSCTGSSSQGQGNGGERGEGGAGDGGDETDEALAMKLASAVINPDGDMWSAVEDTYHALGSHRVIHLHAGDALAEMAPRVRAKLLRAAFAADRGMWSRSRTGLAGADMEAHAGAGTGVAGAATAGAWAVGAGAGASVIHTDIVGGDVAMVGGGWGLTPGRPIFLRSAEYHSYTSGGGVTDTNHRDTGSVLTVSVLLEAPPRGGGGKDNGEEGGVGGRAFSSSLLKPQLNLSLITP